MTLSVNSNPSALLTLQLLGKANDQLGQTQSRISSGQAVSSPKDDASVWAAAQGQRADISDLGAVTASLNRASSISDTALAAGESVSDLLNQIKAKVTAAQDASLDPATRQALDGDFQGLIAQIGKVVGNASFDGVNLLDGSQGTDPRFLADAGADAFVTLPTKNLTPGGPLIALSGASSLATLTASATALTDIQGSIDRVNAALSDMGAQANQIDTHASFVSKLSDLLQSGVGDLVDADLTRESARLAALQVQQQLGTQSLSIANATPQALLSLFR